jgi:hypothetical protein
MSEEDTMGRHDRARPRGEEVRDDDAIAENANESGSGLAGVSEASVTATSEEAEPVAIVFTSPGSGVTSAPATTIEGVTTTEEAPVTLFYDGETPSANFPVQAKDGSWIYVHAKKGRNTAPLPADVATKLLAGGKGFRIAEGDQGSAEASTEEIPHPRAKASS